MRRILTALVALTLLGLALPAAADETGCVTVTVEHADGRGQISGFDWSEGAPYWAQVARYVWFDWSGGDDSFGLTDTLSFDISDPTIVSVVACEDGSVTINHADSEPVAGPSEPAVESLAPLCGIHPDRLAWYCQLDNLTLVS